MTLFNEKAQLEKFDHPWGPLKHTYKYLQPFTRYIYKVDKMSLGAYSKIIPTRFKIDSLPIVSTFA